MTNGLRCRPRFGCRVSVGKINRRVLRREDGRRDGRAAMHYQDGAMGGIYRKEQRVMQRDFLGGPRAERIEEQCGVASVRVSIDELPYRLNPAGVAAPPIERDVLIRVLSDGRLMAMDFSPGQPAIAVIVEFQHEVQIPQRDVPLTVNRLLGGRRGRFRRQRQIGVARRVGVRSLGVEEAAQHGESQHDR